MFFFQASTLPMSIIIVGVGDADFEGNNRLPVKYCNHMFIWQG